MVHVELGSQNEVKVNFDGRWFRFISSVENSSPSNVLSYIQRTRHIVVSPPCPLRLRSYIRLARAPRKKKRVRRKISCEMLSYHCPWTMGIAPPLLRNAGAGTASLSMPYASRCRPLRPRAPLLTTHDARLEAQSGRRVGPRRLVGSTAGLVD